MESSQKYRLLIPGLRRLLYVACILVIIAGYQLFVLTEQTDKYFAWTVKSHVTAAFYGAAYWSSLLVVFLSARQKYWARARTVLPGVALFTTLAMVASLMHYDKFHFQVEETGPLVACWAWFLVYVGVPPLLIYLLIQQLRVKGPDLPGEAPLPNGLKILIFLAGGAMVAVGGIQFFNPKLGATFWPWGLSPLTGRVTGAWLIGLGAAAINVVRDNDFIRARPIFLTAVAFGILQVSAVLRYPTELNWNGFSSWFYLVVLLGIFCIGIYGVLYPAFHRAKT